MSTRFRSRRHSRPRCAALAVSTSPFAKSRPLNEERATCSPLSTPQTISQKNLPTHHRGGCLPPLAAQSKGVLAVLAQLKRAPRDAAAGGRGDGAPPPPSSSSASPDAAAATEAKHEHHAAKLSDSLATHAAAAADDGSGSEKDYSATMRLMDGVEVGRGRRDGLVVWRMKILPLTCQRNWWWPVGRRMPSS